MIKSRDHELKLVFVLVCVGTLLLVIVHNFFEQIVESLSIMSDAIVDSAVIAKDILREYIENISRMGLSETNVDFLVYGGFVFGAVCGCTACYFKLRHQRLLELEQKENMALLKLEQKEKMTLLNLQEVNKMKVHEDTACRQAFLAEKTQADAKELELNARNRADNALVLARAHELAVLKLQLKCTCTAVDGETAGDVKKEQGGKGTPKTGTQ